MVSFNRFVGCLLAGLLGLVAAPAFAQNVTYPNMGAAYAACEAYRSCLVANYSGPFYPQSADYDLQGYSCNQVFGANNDTLYARVALCTSPGCTNSPPAAAIGIANCPSSDFTGTTGSGVNLRRSFVFDPDGEEEPNPCEGKPEFVSRTLRAPTANGSGSVCHDGCAATVAIGYVGTYPAGYVDFTFGYSGAVCASEPAPTEEPLGGPLDLPPEEGGVDTDVPDPGDGTPASSGGGTCDQPPACTGDSIQCNILYQTWASRCASSDGDDGDSDRLDRIGDGVDSLGDGLDRIGDGIDGLGDGLDRIGDGIDGLRGDLASGWSDGGVGPGDFSDFVGEKSWSLDDLDISGMGLPRSCPAWQDISFSIAGQTVTIGLSQVTIHCTIFEWSGYLILAFAAFWSARILLKGD